MATPTIDYIAAWAGIGTAAGTLALAGATHWLGRKTRDLADDAQRELEAATQQAAATAAQAESTREMVVVAQDQMRRAQMPVVVPIALGEPIERPNQPHVVYADPTEKPVVKVPRVLGGVLYVPIANVGVGPAFDIEASFEFLDRLGNPSVAPQPHQIRPGVYTGLGAGQETELRPEFGNLATPILPFHVTVEYEDSFAVRYAIRATYFPDERVYRGVTLVAPRERTSPVRTGGVGSGALAD